MYGVVDSSPRSNLQSERLGVNHDVSSLEPREKKTTSGEQKVVSSENFENPSTRPQNELPRHPSVNQYT